MTAVSPAAFEAFRTAKQQAYEAAGPITTQGRLVEVENASTRAGLEAAAPLLVAEALGRVHAKVRTQMAGIAAYDPHCEAADALDWVLQRLDEEMGR